MSAFSPVRDTLAKRIAGEIVLSSNPGQTMRKWRGLLNVNQMELADELDLSPSVISIDQGRGGDYIRQMARITIDPSDVFTDIREFTQPVTVEQLCRAVEAEILTGVEKLDNQVLGYTIIDSVKAITTLSGLDFYRIFGATSERALIFTEVSQGRSPMIAVKISPFKPRVVILHGKIRKIDPLAVNLAEHEGIPLGYSRLPTEEELVDALVDLYKKKS
jgi:putative transcriptional regulator